MTENPGSSVSELFRLFRSSLRELGYELPASEIESRCFVVHRAMSGRTRDYHNVGHIFAVAAGLPALGRIAAIYHDTIYFHVDQGMLPEIQRKIGAVFTISGGKVHLAEDLQGIWADVALLFGFKGGQELSPFGGMNEFLSAAFAVTDLADYLRPADLLKIAACIEATIPFRRKDAEGKSPADRLAARLAELNTARGLGLSADQIGEAVELSVALANSDVQSFAYAEAAVFLDSTWKLLPETNPEFHMTGTYSIRKYRTALQKVEGFLSGLDPEVIFHEHGATPGLAQWRGLVERARANLKTGVGYLRAKLLAMSVLEAFAELTGGDAPIAYFAGAADSSEKQLQDFLPAERPHAAPTYDPVLLGVLKHGRASPVHFDTIASPISAFLYERFGTAGVETAFEDAKKQGQAAGKWQEFLDGLPGDLVADLAVAAAQIADGRRELLLAIAKAAKLRKGRRDAA
jgi:hypothetical protein